MRVIPSDKDDNIIQAIAVNMDSYAIKRYMSKSKVNTEAGIKFAKDKYFSNVYIHSLFLYGIFDKLGKTKNNEFNWDVEELIPTIFQTYASCLLYINTDEAIVTALQGDE